MISTIVTLIAGVLFGALISWLFRFSSRGNAKARMEKLYTLKSETQKLRENPVQFSASNQKRLLEITAIIFLFSVVAVASPSLVRFSIEQPQISEKATPYILQIVQLILVTGATFLFIRQYSFLKRFSNYSDWLKSIDSKMSAIRLEYASLTPKDSESNETANDEASTSTASLSSGSFSKEFDDTGRTRKALVDIQNFAIDSNKWIRGVISSYYDDRGFGFIYEDYTAESSPTSTENEERSEFYFHYTYACNIEEFIIGDVVYFIPAEKISSSKPHRQALLMCVHGHVVAGTINGVRTSDTGTKYFCTIVDGAGSSCSVMVYPKTGVKAFQEGDSIAFTTSRNSIGVIGIDAHKVGK